MEREMDPGTICAHQPDDEKRSGCSNACLSRLLRPNLVHGCRKSPKPQALNSNINNTWPRAV